MRSPRWTKVLRDVMVERGRVSLMIIAIAVSLVAIGSVLGAYAVLKREMIASYLGTRPASATLEIPQGVDAALLQRVRRHPLIAEAEAREVVVARTRVGDDWRRTLLFVVDDFEDLRLNTFRLQQGAFPPPDATVLIERSAVSMLGAGLGQRLLIKPPHGTAREVGISGVVHDPGLAPAWQERSGYVYLTRSTLAWLGEPAVLGELRIELSGRPLDPRVIEERAAEVSRWLGEQGYAVKGIRIPPPNQHPHQRQMTTILLMMLGFGAMALLLSAILVATSLAAMLARQVREIGIMKTLGAHSGQLAGMYVVLIGALGVVAVVLALPVGILGASLFVRAISTMLNFTINSSRIPHWVFAVEVSAGLVVPLLLALWPIRRAARTTIRQALDDHGTTGERFRARLAWLPTVLRNAFRRPARLALTLGLLSAGGAMFLTAINVKRGWEANVAKVYETRSYDVEVQLQAAEPTHIVELLRRLPVVRAIEAWGFTPAAFARQGQIDVVRTYPDRGHGSLLVMAPPPSTSLVHFPLKAGRWLAAGDTDAVVLNHAALAQRPDLGVGSHVALSLDGQPTTWRIVGIVEEIGSPGIAYVADEAFARVTHTEGRARLLRIETNARTPRERTNALRAIERSVMDVGAGVESVVPLAELRTAVGDHILILVQSLVAMAIILAIVGALGLTLAMGVSVVERTREIAVMKTLGAAPARIVRMLVAEGLGIGIMSWFVAFALSVGLTWFVDGLIGRLGFLAPLPLVLSPAAAVGWALLVIAVAWLATLLPALRASRLVIREALAYP